ncbi:hypothetical protein QCN32_gp47 [Arthrobacter phage Niktson]|uniref:Uncharacterized protein n=1 Tax=Arthrobacter phage Niktson TaxID=2014347 RepID=A0A218M5L4_9CAUD|nr:hypothetical protein QCN32_gp47 [Arthrobacter phage Niktson]ASD52271.1 hypothetical protein NIKTSON_47 [Arthrobacter phage Niktson]ASD52364.1 hypothetical protein ELEPHANTMAN_47 [Arthrobacter phage ElephantMan]
MKVRNLIIFAAGAVSGAIALPAAFIYVKPVRTKLVNYSLARAKDRLATAIVENPKLRRELIEKGSEALTGLIMIDELTPKEGK